MSPIFVRPVREQLEHDRLIRHLATKYKKKYEVGANVGDEQVAAVKIGSATFFPDLVLTDGRKLVGVVEVETGESVNNLEAMAQWVHFARARVAFYLYVPVNGYDAARRLSDANQAHISEIWTYRPVMDGFDLVRVSADPSAAAGSRRAGSLPAVAILAPPPQVVKVAAPVPEVVPPPPTPVVAAVAKNGDVKNGKDGKNGAKEPAKVVVKPPAKISKPAAKPVPATAMKPAKKLPARQAAKPAAKPVAKPAKPARPARVVKARSAGSAKATQAKKKSAPAPKAAKNAKKKSGSGRSR